MVQIPALGTNLMDTESSLYKVILDNLYDGVYFVDTDRRVTYWNPGAERLTGYTSDEVVGTQCQEKLLRHIDEHGCVLCDASCPFAQTLTDGKAHEVEMYLHHKQGYRLPVLVRVSPVFDAENRIIGAVQTFSDNTAKIAAVNRTKELEEIAFLDPLTSLGNRRFTEANLRNWLDQMQRYSWPFGLMFVDIDNFKRVNDTYGHDIGDEVLRMVARTMMHNSRPFDVLGRWGGEEFIAIVVNVTQAHLSAISHRFRLLVEQSSLDVDGTEVQVTVSIGATLARKEDTLDLLVKRADKYMYHSKQQGRNRVTLDEA
jgi:diguanylate cyclase (GGDEF)-like protein/PAS domain S-box-containing protein